MESETKYDLEQPFVYSFQGENHTASHIILKEPNSTQIAECGRIRKWLNQALRENRDRNEEAVSDAIEEQKATVAEAEADGETLEETEGVEAEIMIGILSASEIPLDKLYETVQKIIVSKGMGMIDGQTTMLPPHLKKLSAHDMELMIGTFIGSFFLR